MATKPARPISPHLMHVRWPVTMMVSITHRATGDGMATIGTLLLVWWLAALAAGREAYAAFLDVFTTASGGLNLLGYVVGIGLSWALFQHIASGVRHLVMDTGAGFELKVNRAGAWATYAGAAIATIVFWAYLLGSR